jgi:molecular chaperone HscB
MGSPDTAAAAQVCRQCGAVAAVDSHFCPQCRLILPLGRGVDYFAFLGLPRKLNVDSADLERRFRALSRQFHPDYFYNATPAERRASLERSSYLNDAYRTLKQPTARIEYLLRLEGAAAASPREASREVPAALLEEVFALNEELDDIRNLRAGGASADTLKPRLARARAPIERKRVEHERELNDLAARWDALDGEAAEAERRPVLDALRERTLERQYISNLLDGIDRELSHPV